MTAETPRLASAALLWREDGRVLLIRVRQSDGESEGLWSLPMQAVGEEEAAEEVLGRLLRDRLHVQPRTFEFAETLSVAGAGDARYVVNVFTCFGWTGEPRFSQQHYEDAAWVHPGEHGSLALVPELQGWFDSAFGREQASRADAAAIAALLVEARQELIAACESIAALMRERPLDESWSPLDVLAHAASAEAYYAGEARRLLETPGHSWRPFNIAQWEDDHRSRPPAPEAELRARLDKLRTHTLAWLETLDRERLAAYGNHPQRGAVTVGDRIEKIARHDREHTAQLRAMIEATGKDNG